MLGIIVQLLISWFIVWLYEKNNLRVLGFFLSGERISAFVLFFFVTAACCTTGFLLKMGLAGQRWQLNPELNAMLIFEGIWWNIKSVMFEELIFRGVLLYILIRKLGIAKAIVISAVAFGIYHWFSFGIIGNPAQMVIVFIITGTMGLLYAYSYARTMSLFVPCAIHLGWNITQGFIFSEGSIGTGILQHAGSKNFSTDSYAVFFAVFLIPMLSALLVNFYLLRKMKPVPVTQAATVVKKRKVAG